MDRRNGTLLVNLDTIAPGDPLRIIFTTTDGRVNLHGTGGLGVVEVHRQTRSGWVVVKELGLVFDIKTTLAPGESVVATWDVPTNATPGQYRAVYHTIGPEYTAPFSVCSVSNLRDRYDDDLLDRDGVWGVSGQQELTVHVESAQIADRVHTTLPTAIVECPVPVRFDIGDRPVVEPEDPEPNESEVNTSRNFTKAL